jgi:hypothetical protein
MIAWVLASIFMLSTGGLGFLLHKSAKRLLQFDNLFEMLTHDMETNIRYYEKLAVTPILSDVTEVKSAHHNMQIMGARMEEYVLQMEELTHRRLRSMDPTPPPNPPVVR